MTEITSQTALIIIDVQDGLDDPTLGQRNNPDAEANMARLLDHWRKQGWPVYFIQHMSTNPESPLWPERPGNAIKQAVLPHDDEPVLTKLVNSAFIGTDLEDRLRIAAIDSLVLVGLTTDHCVSASTRMASDLGFNTIVVADATAAHENTAHDGTHYPAEIIHNVALTNLKGEFATIMLTDHVLMESFH